ncbi:hypothetical protein C8A03DRAFT_46513 [Achaetomium macrosporum]|uniref:Uncharacterized protein n=1 Tax=Achaetomium macrosporum TaxID=79813 RepID=A0AAN7HBX6_9PEZI|nr:hypothetical protein C8A03DRAFT_46513 [Achaetomium macrosporum]
MGNETSKPEISEGRSRSLSPLPRDGLYSPDGGDDQPPLPSTMPASLATGEKRARPQRDPELSGKRRHRRSHMAPPETGRVSTDGRPLNASQPADSTVRALSPERTSRPATQPELSEVNDYVPLQRPGQVVTVLLTHPHGPVHESDMADAAEDVAAPQRKPSKKNKGKGKEVSLPEDSGPEGSTRVSDIGNEPPPSAQPPRKRGRRESDSKARKKKKSSQKTSTPESDAEVKQEPLDDVSGLVEPTAPERTEGGSRAAVRASTKRPPISNSPHFHSDSGYAEPDDQVQTKSEPEMDVEIPDGLPRSTGSEADALPDQNTAAVNTDDEITRNAGDETALGSDAASPEPALRNAGEEEANEHRDEQARINNNSQPSSPPRTASAKSPGSRSNTKRKTKRPFFPREDEENAQAFSELPADVAALTRSTRSKKPQVPVQGDAGPSAMTRNERKRKTRKEENAERAELSEEDDHPTGIRQYRSGPLSQTEQDAVAITQEEAIQLIHADPRDQDQAASRHLWAWIQDACPSRPRQKLINWCRQRFHNYIARGKWTKEQDDELAHLVEVHGKKWSLIAGLINRHQKDVRDRWRNYLICRDKVKTDVWSEDEEERLRELVEQSIENIRKKLPENSRKSPEQLINWLAISEAMGYTRSRLQCMEKWKRMRASEPIPDKAPTVLPPGSSWRLEKARTELRKITVNDKYTLVRAVRDSGVGTDKKINWKHIVRDIFGGKYERQTLIVTWGRLRQTVPDWEWKTTRDCARHLCDMYEREGNLGTAEGGEAEEERYKSPPSSPPLTAKANSRKRPVTADSTTKDNGARFGESHSKRSKGKRSTRGRAETSTEDVAMRDQAPIEPSALFTHNSRPVEEQPSPELGFEQSQLSPTVKAQAARTKRRERRASVAEQSSVSGENDDPPPAPKAAHAKTPKNSRESFSNGDTDGPERRSPRLKKRKLSGFLSAKTAKVNNRGGKAAMAGEAEGRPLASGKSWSVISSDMDDDMEDIPATLPASWRSGN